MAATNPPFWQRKGFLQLVQVACLTGTAAVGGIAAAIDDATVRARVAGIGGAFVLIGGLTGIQSKRVEDRDKADLAALKGRCRDQAKRMAKAVLSHMHGHFFEKESEDDKHTKHRITLFRCVAGAGPDADRKDLVLYARVGYNANSKTTWPLDESKPGGCPGVAGEVWESYATVFREADCDWPGSAGSPAEKARYADSLKITVEQAESLTVQSRYFAGAIVESRGAKWGVLLVDSLKDFRHAVPGQYTLQVKRLVRYATLLGQLVAEDGE